MKETITPRSEDYSNWYQNIIDVAELAEHSAVRGFMVIKPYGYAIWENIQKILDKKIKDTGHSNAYFPLLIPKSFMSREAEHVEGFAKEMAVVTHHRLVNNPDGSGLTVDPEAKLDEELIIRPTSETIINDAFSRWVQSWRDLPLLVNQWANVVRWELRPRLFLRSTEFLWQEGHTAHETQAEAAEEVDKMLNVYKDLLENYLAIPVITGRKSPSETFAGADYTTTIEAMMQDGRALQAGTSHMLGQNFAKVFGTTFTDRDGEQRHVWQTSWGVSTRLIGGLIMVHSDDKGLVLPPKIAPTKVVIIPIWNSAETKELVLDSASKLKEELLQLYPYGVVIDERDARVGEKHYTWEKKGVPLRIEIGPKDIESNSLVLVRRDTGEKIKLNRTDVSKVDDFLEDIQSSLYNKALSFREDRTKTVDTWEEFKEAIESGFFVSAHWSGGKGDEQKIKEETKATVRCIPFDQAKESGKCVYSGKPSEGRVIFARAY